MALAWAMLRYGYEASSQSLSPPPWRRSPSRGAASTPWSTAASGGQARAAKAGGIATTQGGSQGGVQGGSRPSGRGGSQQKEKEKEIALAGYSAARQAPDDFEPPSAEDVEAYFAANCLRGDARQFFDHYAAQGWTLPSGLPVTDVWALARNWSRKQVGFDADRKARGGQTSQEVERAAVWQPVKTDDELIAELDRQIAEAS